MKILHEHKIKKAIRDILAVDPLVSAERMQNLLFERGFKTAGNQPMTWRYVNKLVRKVDREVLEETLRNTPEKEVAKFKEHARIVFERLMRIAFYTEDLQKQGMPAPSYKEQIAALTALVKLKALIINIEMDMGIFERHIGTLEVEKRYIPLPAEVKEQMMRAFQNLGFVLPEQLKEIEPPKAETINANNGTAQSTQPAAL